MMDAIPDIPLTGSYALVGLKASDFPGDARTDAIAVHLAGRQIKDGRWLANGPRPPLEYSDFSATAMSLRAADIHDEQARLIVQRIVALLVPVITITMGLAVAGIVGSLLTAMLSLNDLAM